MSAVDPVDGATPDFGGLPRCFPFLDSRPPLACVSCIKQVAHWLSVCGNHWISVKVL